jgi:hypothetical protein
MSGLSPEARSIIEAARGGDDPSPHDRKRVRSSLVLRLGAGAATVGAATSAGTAAAAGASHAAGTGLLVGLLPKGFAVLSAVTAIGVGAYVAHEPEAPSQEAVVSVTVSSSPPPAASEVRVPFVPVEPQPPTEIAPTVERPNHAPAPAKVPEGPSLASEVESLREAHTALREGKANEALDVLDRDAAPADSSALDQERAAVRIFALCRLGQTDEARRLAGEFLTKWPSSPHAPRVRTACPSP